MELKDYRDAYDRIQLSKEADERILNKIYEGKGKKPSKSSGYMKKVVAATLIFLITASGIAYAGMKIWDMDVAEKFGVKDNENQMKDLTKHLFSDYRAGSDKENLTAADAGITVEVVQTLCDERVGYIYMIVDFGDTYQIENDKVPLPEIDYFAADEMESGLNGGVSIEKIYNDHKVGYASYISPEEEQESMKDIQIVMNISQFYNGSYDEESDTYKDTVVAEGNWNLSWKLSTGTEKRIYLVNQTITYESVEFKVKELEISPLSCMVTVEFSDEQAYEKLMESGTESGMTAFYFGTKNCGRLGSSMVYLTTDDDTGITAVTEKMQFDQIVDLNKLTAFAYGDTKIDLTKVKYKSET